MRRVGKNTKLGFRDELIYPIGKSNSEISTTRAFMQTDGFGLISICSPDFQNISTYKYCFFARTFSESSFLLGDSNIKCELELEVKGRREEMVRRMMLGRFCLSYHHLTCRRGSKS
jgi:hypothetical protein